MKARYQSEQQLAQLYRRHGTAVHRYLVGRTFGDVHLAEDLLQETFLRAWRSARTAEGDDEPGRAWLLTVARNLVVDRVRYRASRPPETEATALPSVPAPHCDTDRLDTALTVRQALATLTPLRREILVQMYLRDRPVRQIAESLGIPEGTVKSRAHAALRALRTTLSDPCPDQLCAA